MIWHMKYGDVWRVEDSQFVNILYEYKSCQKYLWKSVRGLQGRLKAARSCLEGLWWEQIRAPGAAWVVLCLTCPSEPGDGEQHLQPSESERRDQTATRNSTEHSVMHRGYLSFFSLSGYSSFSPAMPTSTCMLIVSSDWQLVLKGSSGSDKTGAGCIIKHQTGT